MNSQQRYNRATRASLDLFKSLDEEPTFEDYDLAARYTDAKQTLASLEYQASKIRSECKRKLEQIRPATEQAQARIKRLQPAYNELCARLKIEEKAS